MAPSKASSKASSKKHQKKGVDFKKIKRKIGRKLPPPKNATNTEIKTKAIILPEQSLAVDRGGLAVSKRGLTLKELLKQSLHHNAKVRKDALMGIRDLLLTNPAELTRHKFAIIEMLGVRVGDDDKVVRETLYQLFKTVIFLGCKEEHQSMFISLLMPSILHAMTMVSIEVQLMAFKFLELVVQHYPDSLFMCHEVNAHSTTPYAKKIFKECEDILWKNKFNLQEKGKLKIVLASLVRCLLLLPCNNKEDESAKKKVAERRFLYPSESDSTKYDGCSAIIPELIKLLPVLVKYFEQSVRDLEDVPSYDAQSLDCMLCLLRSINLSAKFYPFFTDEDKAISTVISKLLVAFPLNPVFQVSEKVEEIYFTLNSTITEIFLRLRKWITPAVSLEKFLEFIESALLGKIYSDTHSGKSVKEKNLLPLLPFLPKLVSEVASDDWKSRILKAFTKMFKNCHPKSLLKLASLSAIEQMIIPTGSMVYLIPDILDHQVIWVQELPELLLLCDNDTHYFEAVAELLRKFAVSCVKNPQLAQEFENMQYSLRDFYSTCLEDGTIRFGPFVRLPSEYQVLGISWIPHFRSLDPSFLTSLKNCCLSPDLKCEDLLHLLEILRSCMCDYGNVYIAYYLRFHRMLLSDFRVYPENIYPVDDHPNSNRTTFELLVEKAYKNIVDPRLTNKKSLILWLLEEKILETILSARLPLDNVRALLWLMVKLDSKEPPHHLSAASDVLEAPSVITSLGVVLPRYLIDIARCVPKYNDQNRMCVATWTHFFDPCFVFFVRSPTLVQRALQNFASLITFSGPSLPTDASSTVDAISSVLCVLHRHASIRRILSTFKEDVELILQKIVCLQTSEEIRLTLEEKQKIESAVNQLKNTRLFLRKCRQN